MTHLYLVRHGESMGNVNRSLDGFRGDKGLTELGRMQARRLRDRLAATGEIKADVLIASPLPRARQTAEIIAPALNLSVELDEEIQEMTPGEADGINFKEAIERFGFPDIRNQPFRPMWPGGENWGQFTLRVGTALDRITREHSGKTIVLVCHGGVIDAAFLYFFGMNTLAMPQVDFFTHNTSITYWEQRERRNETKRWRLVFYNDTFHLRDMQEGKFINWGLVSSRPLTGSDQPAMPLPTEETRDQ